MGGIYIGIVKTVAADGRVFVSIPKLGNTIGPLRVANSNTNSPLLVEEQVLCAFTSMSNDEMYVLGYVNARDIFTPDLTTPSTGQTLQYNGTNWVNTGFAYKVGDTGPGGGIIFFVDRYNEYSGFTYLEVAPVGTEVQRTWATGGNWTAQVSGADSRALGGGYQNTIDIVTQAGNVAATCAAAYCADLVSGGQSDWYLPSWAEIKMVNDIVHLGLSVGGFLFSMSGEYYYWSSTERSATEAWSADFHYGYQSNGPKNQTYYVRPVRRF